MIARVIRNSSTQWILEVDGVFDNSFKLKSKALDKAMSRGCITAEIVEPIRLVEVNGRAKQAQRIYTPS